MNLSYSLLQPSCCKNRLQPCLCHIVAEQPFYPPLPTLISLFSNILLVFTMISLQTTTHQPEAALPARLAGHAALQ